MDHKTKTALRIGVSALIVLSVLGCIKTEFSQVLTEKAEITEVVYAPSRHGSGGGFGMTTEGDLVMTLDSVDIPAVYAVVFKCEHGKFIINRKDVWEKAKVGMHVTVRYREVYKVSKKERRLVKYNFLGFDP